MYNFIYNKVKASYARLELKTDQGKMLSKTLRCNSTTFWLLFI